MIKIATLALLGTLIGLAQPPVQKIPHRTLKALNLSDAQKQQAKSLFQQSKQNAQPLRQQLKQNREAISAAIQGNNAAEIQRLAGLQGNLQSQMIANRAQAMAKFYATLTPEQAARAKEMRDKRKAPLQKF